MRELSAFGRKFGGHTGIMDLMDDMGRALSGSEKKFMLGGGNPAHIAAVNAVWRRRFEEVLGEAGGLERLVANYDPPQGNVRMVEALAEALSERLGRTVGPENVALTNGSQAAFFLLFNMIAGQGKKVLFPLMPEYVGYADQSLGPHDFVAVPPRIERIDAHTHKYGIDFEALPLDDSIGAICVSRPTNPSGNVLTDAEILRLDERARSRGIPLIVDNAYGAPFPGIVFEPLTPLWNENIILSMSLSKLGLPGVRTGIIVASADVVRTLSAANAVVSLANANTGPVLVEPLVRSGELFELADRVIRPFYRERASAARAVLDRHFTGIPYSVHRCEGSIFLWLWLEGLPIPTRELYRRLKERHVIVVPGEYFFFGLPADADSWTHRRECVRINYAAPTDDVEEGLGRIAEEIRAL